MVPHIGLGPNIDWVVCHCFEYSLDSTVGDNEVQDGIVSCG